MVSCLSEYMVLVTKFVHTFLRFDALKKLEVIRILKASRKTFQQKSEKEKECTSLINIYLTACVCDPELCTYTYVLLLIHMSVRSIFLKNWQAYISSLISFNYS